MYFIFLNVNYLYEFKFADDLTSRAAFLGFAGRTLGSPGLNHQILNIISEL